MKHNWIYNLYYRICRIAYWLGADSYEHQSAPYCGHYFSGWSLWGDRVACSEFEGDGIITICLPFCELSLTNNDGNGYNSGLIWMRLRGRAHRARMAVRTFVYSLGLAYHACPNMTLHDCFLWAKAEWNGVSGFPYIRHKPFLKLLDK